MPSQPLITIIGGGCSPATNALIGIAEYQNIPLVSLLYNTPRIIVVLKYMI